MLAFDRADGEWEEISTQAIPILKDPRILAAAVEANRRVLTPLWLELIEEGRVTVLSGRNMQKSFPNCCFLSISGCCRPCSRRMRKKSGISAGL